MGILRLLVLVCLILSCGPGEVASIVSFTIHEVATRSTTIRFLIAKRTITNGKMLILFPGGDGTCHFGFFPEKAACGRDSSNSIDVAPNIWVSYNFLARNMERFAQRGYVVVLVDMPEDVKARFSASSLDPKVISSRYRVGTDWDEDNTTDNSLDVVEDVEAVVSYVTVTLGVPVVEVYLVGTSRGTLAAAYVSHQITATGVVLTATVSSDGLFSDYCPSSSSDFISCTGINGYAGRVIMVHHQNDGCPASTHTSANTVYGDLTISDKHFTTVTGGSEVSSDPCAGKTYHGFWGRDGDVVSLILDWIEGRPVPGSI